MRRYFELGLLCCVGAGCSEKAAAPDGSGDAAPILRDAKGAGDGDASLTATDAGSNERSPDSGKDVAVSPIMDASRDAPGLDDGGASGDAEPAPDAAQGDAAQLPEAGAVVPGAFPSYPPAPFPEENAPSDEKGVLGKILFWEEQLSSDDTVACGTCHRPSAGGSDPRSSDPGSRHPGPDAMLGTTDDIHGAQGVVRCQIGGDAGTVSYIGDPVFGMDPQVTRRRPPSYLDAMFFPDLFWDGRATSEFVDPETGLVAISSGGALESQAVGPPLSDAEMACEDRSWSDITGKLETVTPLVLASDLPPDIQNALAASPKYPDLFEAAFGSPDITARRIAFAIATHERRLTSDQTPWDQWNAGDESAMTPAQIAGFEVFMGEGRCNVCHAPPLFTDSAYHNLGFVDATFDTGRQEVTGLESDRGRFKTPTLRNVGLREPGGLTHVGSGHGATMFTIMDAYDRPPNEDPNVDPEMRLLGLSDEQLVNIVDFLRNGLTDPRVQNEQPPFDRPKLGSEP